jgi:hypothetical protein
MPRHYVDNAMNRGIGRVGMTHGSMPVSRSSGSGVEVTVYPAPGRMSTIRPTEV